jgi:hypothetical protein
MVWGWVQRVVGSLLVSPSKLADMPALAAHSLSPEHVCDAAGVQRLAELGPHNALVVSVDDVVSPAARARTLRHALEDGVVILFVEAVNTAEGLRLTNELRGIAVRLDEPPETGQRALYGVNVTALLRATLAGPEQGHLEDALRGMPAHRTPRKALALLPESMLVQRTNWVQRTLRHPSMPVYLIVFIYSSLRVLPVALIREFHGSLLVLWAIDIITAVPYTWGVLAMLFAPKRRIRLLAALTTLVTFVGPYVYFWMHGRGYPPYVPIVIVALTLGSVLLEANRYRQEQQLRRRYRSVSAAPAKTVSSAETAAEAR